MEYVYQELEDLPYEGYHVPEGTSELHGEPGGAILACEDVVKEPFSDHQCSMVHYGQEAFVELHEFLLSWEHTCTDKINLATAVTLYFKEYD
ncbi:MAG: hypothetical protein ACLT76_02890 [Clostridium fessum]